MNVEGGRAAAKLAMDSGQFQEAERLLRAVLAAQPRDVDAMTMLALLAANTGRTELAMMLLNKALRVDPDCINALLWMGSSLRARGQATEALALAERAVKVNPSLAAAHSELGLCFQSLGDSENAVNSFESALQLDEGLLQVHLVRAQLLNQMGRYDAAEAGLLKVLELWPESIEANVRLGELRIAVGNRAGAIDCFLAAHRLEPTTERGQVHLAKALIEGNSATEAVAVVRKVIDSFPGSVPAKIFYGKMLQGFGRFDEAKEIFQTALQLEPGRPELYYDMAFCGRIDEKDQALLAGMRSLIAQGNLSLEDHSNLCYALGKSYNDLNQYENAFRYFDEANELMLQRLPTGPIVRETVEANVDFLVETFTAEFIEVNKVIGAGSELPILIVGMIRSGTSLLEQILSSHPQIQGAGELQFWQKNAPDALAAIAEHRLPGPARSLIERYQSLLEGIGGEARRVTDKMPLNFMYAGLIHVLFPNARIVHCRRNPKDTCLSIYMTPYRLPVDFGHDKDTIAFFYEQYLRLMSHWQRVLPSDRFFEVDYESVVEDREQILRRLIDFCGLPWDDSCLSPEDNARLVTTPSQWQVRQPIYRSSQDRWRKYEPWLGPFARL